MPTPEVTGKIISRQHGIQQRPEGEGGLAGKGIENGLLASLRENDRILLRQLRAHDRERGTFPSEVGIPFRNRILAGLVKREYSASDIATIQKTLQENEALTVPIRNGHFVHIDDHKTPLYVTAATEANTNYDMSKMVWIRDMTQEGKAKFEIWRQNPQLSAHQGDDARKLLFSSMHLMSTEENVGRAQRIVANPLSANDYLNWPQIAIETDKLDGSNPTNWRHNQDAFQMLGVTLFDAMDKVETADRPLISVGELKKGNKEFLGSLMPFLASVDFTRRENCGSWEEVPAVRTSVISIETALLTKIRAHAGDPEFAFLRQGFEKSRANLLKNKGQTTFKGTDFNEHTTFEGALDMMIDQGLQKIAKQLPFETPPQEGEAYSAKHTKADVALLYLLDYDIPQLLADPKRTITIKATGKQMNVREIEAMILGEVGKLYDPVTQGLIRYGGEDDPTKDTYLGPNYHTDENMFWIDRMKDDLKREANGGAIDLVEKRQRRMEIVRKGRAAAWVHPTAQLSAWAGRRYLETDDEWYLKIATETFTRTLALATGEGEYHAILNGDGHHHIQPVKAFRFPESYTTLFTEDGVEIISPSPNTPLNWAASKAEESTAILHAALTKKELATAA